MGRTVAFLFGGVFGSVGIGMFAFVVHGIWLWADSATWESIPANIDTLELEASHGDATTYRVVCSYDYTVDGRNYTGETPSLYSASDNIGSFHHDLHERLKADRDAGRATCLVDPDEPQRSLLDRTFRPGMLGFELLFVIVFGSVGLVIVSYAFGGRSDREAGGRMRIHSAHLASRFSSKVMMLYHALIAIVVVPTSLVCLVSGYVSALFPLALAGISVATVYFTVRYLFKQHPVAGKLLLPNRYARRSDTATLLLPAGWQGPVDLELRWTIPAPPSNRLGVEDETGDADHVQLPAAGGTTSETEIELPMPALPDKPTSGQPIKLEVIGTIGGYRYQDDFEIADQSLQWLYGDGEEREQTPGQ